MAAKSNLTNMVCCLGAVCLVCAALLGGVYVLTEDAIAQTNAALLRESVGSVLPAGGTLSEALPKWAAPLPSIMSARRTALPPVTPSSRRCPASAARSS